MKFTLIQHTIAIVLFVALISLWLPSELIHALHAHEHTIHNEKSTNGLDVESQHHHCAMYNVSMLPYALVAFIVGKSFLRYRDLNIRIISLFLIIPVIGKSKNRGPPFEPITFKMKIHS